jgi:hypothetical protein
MTEPMYPTWRKASARRYESLEQRDGVPDFIIERDRTGWRVKWRTSACWGDPFPTIAEAKASVKP